jgi:hypothetical protein
MCKRNAEVCSLTAKMSTATSKWTNIFMAHLTGKHKLEHTVAETVYFKPHQKYFRENAYLLQDHS